MISSHSSPRTARLLIFIRKGLQYSTKTLKTGYLIGVPWRSICGGYCYGLPVYFDRHGKMELKNMYADLVMEMTVEQLSKRPFNIPDTTVPSGTVWAIWIFLL